MFDDVDRRQPGADHDVWRSGWSTKDRGVRNHHKTLVPSCMIDRWGCGEDAILGLLPGDCEAGDVDLDVHCVSLLLLLNVNHVAFVLDSRMIFELRYYYCTMQQDHST